jgi:hypothetical protein
MDMYGGLTKTSSRIAIAAALGLTLGGVAMKATPAKAADLGGDCCADLEERVAELEATTVRKGNKKVSVTLSGWVVKSMNWWDDGDISSFAVGDKDADLASRFAITGSATIAPGWSGGFNITVVAPGDVFGIQSNQFNEFTNTIDALTGYGIANGLAIRTLYSYIYIKSDSYGTLNWGYLSPASDNPAVLADISGTVIESNAVFFEGGGFFLRPNFAPHGYAGLSTLSLNNFLTCTDGGGGVGADCFGAPRPAVRYDSPTWGGFRFETSYGTVETANTPDHNFWDIAFFYTADWNSIKLSAAYAFTHEEDTSSANCITDCSDDLHQVGASIMHKPSGLGIYGLWQTEIVDARTAFARHVDFNFNIPDSEVWYIKPFWRKGLIPLGMTTFYGEYGQYNDQFGGINGVNICSRNNGRGEVFECSIPLNEGEGEFRSENMFVTSSEVQRWGLGVVQEIDSAAMHVWARWQHQEIDASFIGCGTERRENYGCRNRYEYTNTKVNFDGWDLFQVGAAIFF